MHVCQTNTKAKMKKTIKALSALLLIPLLAAGLFCFHDSTRKSNAGTTSGEEIRQKKMTLIPFIVIGGIRYFRKAFDKKNQAS